MGTFVLAVAGGMLSFLSPCVLPLVPGYLSLMSGVSVTQLQASATSGDETRRILRATLLFVAGFTLVFTLLGVSASAIGQVLLRHQQGFNQAAGIVTIVMGLFIAGVLVPNAMQRERRFQVLPSTLGVFAPPIMGMAFAFGWTPCIGPILSVVLTTAAAQDTMARGVGLLIAYSLGLGVPFVAAGLGLGRLTSVFGWVKRHFRLINVVSGSFLVAFGLLLFTNNLGDMSAAIQRFLDAIGLDRLVRI